MLTCHKSYAPSWQYGCLLPAPASYSRTWHCRSSLAGAAYPVAAQNTQTAATLAGANADAQKIQRLFPDRNRGRTKNTTVLIPKFEIDPDPRRGDCNGATERTDPNRKERLFRGSRNQRAHLLYLPSAQDGWTVSAQHARDRFDADTNDPLFRLFDGATCPSDDVSTLQAKRKAYSLLLDKGLIRIGLPMPASAQFQVLNVSDPYNCNTDPLTGLTSSSAGIVSIYRRPLPAANLGFLSTIMWDGRETSLFDQAVDATLTHAQAGAAPSSVQQQQMVSFEGCTQADTAS